LKKKENGKTFIGRYAGTIKLLIKGKIDMTERINISSGVKWENIVGYSRAVRIGNIVEVTGTVAVDENGNLQGGNNAYLQADYIFKKIERILSQAGAQMADVTRTRMFVTDISRWEEFGRAHFEAFGTVKPATSMIEVKGLIGSEYLIEVEATAVISAVEKERGFFNKHFFGALKHSLMFLRFLSIAVGVIVTGILP
jgi:enamine deaminase RidA (YjgF/YER057c/UK114 family)